MAPHAGSSSGLMFSFGMLLGTCSIVQEIPSALVNTFMVSYVRAWCIDVGVSVYRGQNGSIVYTIAAAIVEIIIVFHAGALCINVGV
jgi:hypothetical protein